MIPTPPHILLLLPGESSRAAEDEDDGALDHADVAYSANSFMAVVKPVTLCMTLSAFITVSLYSDAEGATNRYISPCVRTHVSSGSITRRLQARRTSPSSAQPPSLSI